MPFWVYVLRPALHLYDRAPIYGYQDIEFLVRPTKDLGFWPKGPHSSAAVM